jgi:sulfate permease, SulP family
MTGKQQIHEMHCQMCGTPFAVSCLWVHCITLLVPANLSRAHHLSALQIVSGLLGGMGGCAMVGQSLINVNAGGVTRVSGVTCGATLLCFILFGSKILSKIPVAALTGVMLMLVIEIFDFTSFMRLNQVPRTDAAVLVTVTAVTYATNLAIAVFVGVVLASLSFAWKSAVRGVSAVKVWDEDTLVYRMHGPLFFGSIQSFKDAMRAEVPVQVETGTKRIVLDFMECRVWDSSAVEAINSESERLLADGWTVRLRHLSKDCQTLLDRAGDMLELEVMEDDPRYGLLSDYDSIVLNRGSVKRIGRVLRGPSSRWPRERPA